MKLYIAASLRARDVAAHFAAALHSRHGHTIVSRWNGTTDTRDPDSDAERRAILGANVADLDAAEAVVALCHVGDPKATFGEIAWALAHGKPVVWLHGCIGQGRNIWDASHLVVRLCEGPRSVEQVARVLHAIEHGRADDLLGAVAVARRVA